MAYAEADHLVESVMRQLTAKDRAFLRALGSDCSYPLTETQLMQYFQSLGIFSLLEECGDTGRATLTDRGREVLARLAPAAPVDTLPKGGDGLPGSVHG